MWLFIEQLTTDDWTKRWRNSSLFAVGSFLLITQNLASLASRGVRKKKRKSYVGPHDFRSFILYDLFYWLNSLSERDTSLLLRETIMCLMSIWYSLSLYYVSGLERRSLITSFQTRYNNLFSHYNRILRKLLEKLPENTERGYRILPISSTNWNAMVSKARF